MLKILRITFATLLLIASLALLAGWWMMRQSLPQVEGSISLPGLKQSVQVARDASGVPTITAQSMDDLVFAQGYVMAQDRLFQMDLIRRSAAGELAEIFGPALVESDIENRRLGLKQAAEASVAATPAENRAAVEAYARGVNAYIEQHRGNLPWEMRVLGYSPRPWSAVDSALVHAYMYRVLAETWEWELNRARVTQMVGAERARDLFVVDNPNDHFIVGEADGAAKPGRALRQVARGSMAHTHANLKVAATAAGLLPTREDFELRAGSNNWVVSGARSYSGKPLLANDTHLPNDVPSIWYMAHLKAPGYNAKGFCLPGGPLVVIGHNERIAWGFTNNGADVQDLYIETFNPENPKQYRVNGKWVDATVRTEVIKVKGGADEKLEVVVTRHGPIVHSDASGKYALRWTALEPGGLGMAHAEVSRAANWQEFLAASRKITGPAQNAVYADVDGNIGFVVAANVPVRKKGDGSVPVPGDTDDYEWSGFIPFEEMPQAFNPASGVIATANARVVGPGYKPFLTDRWYEPWRTHRIYELLAKKEKFTPEDFIRIQTDIYTAPHVFIAQQLQAALARVTPKDARVTQVAALLKNWNGEADKDSREMPLVEFTRRELVRQILRPHLKEEAAKYQWSRSFTFLQRVLTERPAAWLPGEYKDYDELIVACADEAARALERDERQRGERDPANTDTWSWADFVPLQMLHPFGRSGFLRRHLSIADIPQHGASYSVKQTGRTFGPAMRFVADLSDFDKSLMNITVGQSGHYLSPHYKDQFEYWYEGRGLASAFSDAAEAAGAKRKTLTLNPQ